MNMKVAMIGTYTQIRVNGGVVWPCFNLLNDGCCIGQCMPALVQLDTSAHPYMHISYMYMHVYANNNGYCISSSGIGLLGLCPFLYYT